MYDIVHIEPFQKVPSGDLNRFGELPRAAMAAQTRQMLVTGFKFAEFVITYPNGGFALTVSGGFLWKDGQDYRTPDGAGTTIDLVTETPPSDGLRRTVSIIGFVIPPKNDAPEEREFAKVVTAATSSAAATYQSEKRQTTTLNRALAQIDHRTGSLSSQTTPPPPPLTPDLCEIARVTLGRGGIESVVMIEANRAPNLEAVAHRVDDLDDFVEGQGKRIDTLDKNLAALSASIPVPISDAVIRQFARNLASLNAVVKVKAGDLAFNIDYGLDLRWTDNTVSGYAANIDDGIRFPWTSSKEVALALYTPNDPGARLISNLLLPDFTEEARIIVSGMDGSLSISNQVNAVVNAVKVEVPRTSVRLGEVQSYCTNSQYWADGTYNAATQLFTRQGEVFQVLDPELATINHQWVRIQRLFVDTWTETRWDAVTTFVGLNGAIRGQTFKAPDFGYMSSIELPFTTKDASFGVMLLLCEATALGPNLNRVMETSTLNAVDVVADPTGATRTKFSFRPAFLDPGKLYAWVTVTRGNYAIATVKDNKYAGGSSFITTDAGSFFAGDPYIDFAWTGNFCRFKTPRAEFRMNDLDNVNGDPISAIKFLYGSQLPPGTQIIHQLRKAGGDWLTVAPVSADGDRPVVGAGPFATAPLPLSIQHKIIVLGSTTLMPAIDLSQAWATTLKLGTIRNHFTPLINLGTPCNRAEVQVTVDGPFDPVNHATDCKLVVGGATINASAVSFVDVASRPGQRIYTYSFSFTTTSQLRINLPGTLANNLTAYHVDNRFMRAWLV